MSQCRLFDEGEVTGPLCNDLCHTKLLQVQQCLTSVPEKKVFSGSWNGRGVVLKQAQQWFEQMEGIDIPRANTEKVLMELLEDIIERHFGHCANCTKIVRKFLQHANANSDARISQVEAKNFLALIFHQEPFMVALLNGSKHSVDFFGYCGAIYVVEKVPVNAELIFESSVVLHDYIFPEAFDQLDELLRSLSSVVLDFHFLRNSGISRALNFIALNVASIIYRNIYQVRVPSYKERLSFAKSLLEALQTLSESPYGAVQSCDSHIGNFGLTNDSVVKVLDYDQLFAQEYLRIKLGNTKCESDCVVGGHQECASVCDKTTGYCYSDLVSQDLQNSCSSLLRTIFDRTVYQELVNPEDAGAQCQLNVIRKIINYCREIPVVSSTTESRKHVDMVKNLLMAAEEDLKACANFHE